MDGRYAWGRGSAEGPSRRGVEHLGEHGPFNEGALPRLGGGPRRARAFARELDDWRAGLPFEIEVSVVGGAKAYRKVSRA